MLLHFASLLLLMTFASVLAFQPTVRRVTSADGTPIYADAIGNPSKQSIVFVHGFALSGLVFDRFFTNHRLRNDFYLVRYDMRGHGRSGKPTTTDAYTSNHYAEDFAAVTKAFHLKKPVFVGWSLGAAIASDIVENIEPLPILGAVALDGSPVLGPDNLQQLIGTSTVTALSLIFQDTNVTTNLHARMQFVDSLFRQPHDVPFGLKMEYLGQTTVQPPNVSILVTQRAQNSTKLFAAGKAGTLQLQILFGESDTVALQGPVFDFLKPHFKHLTVSTIPGGHAVFEDNPAGTVDALIGFIRKISQ